MAPVFIMKCTRTAGAPDSSCSAPAEVLLPVFIRANRVVVGAVNVLVAGFTTLDGIDRWRQFRQLWSLVFHGIHLLSFVMWLPKFH
jgi:hypothetical protein